MKCHDTAGRHCRWCSLLVFCFVAHKKSWTYAPDGATFWEAVTNNYQMVIKGKNKVRSATLEDDL